MNLKCKFFRFEGRLSQEALHGQEKCRKSASESAGSKRGAKENAKKSAPGPVSHTTAT